MLFPVKEVRNIAQTVETKNSSRANSKSYVEIYEFDLLLGLLRTGHAGKRGAVLSSHRRHDEIQEDWFHRHCG